MVSKLKSILEVLLNLGSQNYISMFYEHENRVNLVKAISDSDLNKEVNISLKYINSLDKFVMSNPYMAIAKYLGCDENMARFLVGNSSINIGQYVIESDNITYLIDSNFIETNKTNHTTHDVHTCRVLNGTTASHKDMVNFLTYMIKMFESNILSPTLLKGREWLVMVD